ncbi:uncharacterized protein I303_105585 [Kwoniella dejecticola CBS 10117]|uniref:Uncharacterized protein n=1 Tax=Kwoniella dejecticola CBS 10117 TaxID=1296121 RepID=A0A1A6A224_9TREE|nr:uncharacterized protein I303_04972 [Kwoniella dejecticola CBS 10117]OBR84115.1 hypothetical protein I303_04972 [Kwoniella dejecticola CBS 10117]
MSEPPLRMEVFKSTPTIKYFIDFDDAREDLETMSEEERLNHEKALTILQPYTALSEIPNLIEILSGLALSDYTIILRDQTLWEELRYSAMKGRTKIRICDRSTPYNSENEIR